MSIEHVDIAIAEAPSGNSDSGRRYSPTAPSKMISVEARQAHTWYFSTLVGLLIGSLLGYLVSKYFGENSKELSPHGWLRLGISAMYLLIFLQEATIHILRRAWSPGLLDGCLMLSCGSGIFYQASRIGAQPGEISDWLIASAMFPTAGLLVLIRQLHIVKQGLFSEYEDKKWFGRYRRYLPLALTGGVSCICFLVALVFRVLQPDENASWAVELVIAALSIVYLLEADSRTKRIWAIS